MDELVTALKAAAEPTRLRILALCLQGELTVSEIVRIMGQSQPRISRHLKLLADAGLLERIREGSWVFYRLATSGIGANLADQISRLIPRESASFVRDLEQLAEVKRDRNQSAADYFNKNAEHWDRLRSLHIDDREVEKAILKLLSSGRIGNLLDIGTGTGRMLELLGPQIDRGEGVDLSPEMLRIARSNLERAELPHCRVRQADIFRLPSADEEFDAAIIHQVLHFVDDPAAVITEAARALTPQGYLVVVDFAPHDLETLRDEHEHRRLGFGENEIVGWFEAVGLESKSIINLSGDPLTVTIWMGQKTTTKILESRDQ